MQSNFRSVFAIGVSYIVEGLPLSVFLIYSRLIDRSLSSNWFGPYLAGSAVATLVTGALIYKKIPLNRCFLGINLYIFIGSLGLVTGWEWFNELLGRLEASGMLAVIVATGFYTSYFSSTGFIGVCHSNQTKLRNFSSILLLVAIFATALSYHFTGNILLGEIIPFVVLFFSQNRLKTKLLVSEVESD